MGFKYKLNCLGLVMLVLFSWMGLSTTTPDKQSTFISLGVATVLCLGFINRNDIAGWIETLWLKLSERVNHRHKIQPISRR